MKIPFITVLNSIYIPTTGIVVIELCSHLRFFFDNNNNNAKHLYSAFIKLNVLNRHTTSLHSYTINNKITHMKSFYTCKNNLCYKFNTDEIYLTDV